MTKTKQDLDGHVSGGYVLDRIISRGGHRVSLATQTGEIRPADSSSVQDGVAPGMPFNPNLYHGAWPIEKGMGDTFASNTAALVDRIWIVGCFS